MKMLFVSNYYPPESLGGYEESCFDVTESLRRKGHDVHVLTSVTEGNAPLAPQVHRRLLMRPSLSTLSPFGTAMYLRHALACERVNPRILSEILAPLQPEAVMFWNASHLGWGIVASAERVCKPLYYLKDRWMLPLLARRQRWRAWNSHPLKAVYYATSRVRFRELVRVGSDRLIFVSPSLRSQYERVGVDVERSATIGNGLPLSKFPVRDTHISRRGTDQPFRVLYCGRIVPEKGILTLIKALAQIQSRPGAERTMLTILGVAQDNGFLRTICRLISDLRLTDSVQFVDHLPRSEVSAIYGDHDVLVFPSEWEEPFGLSVLEAMATGLPVISTLRGGPSMLVRDGINGLAFRAGDAEDLAAKVVWLLSNADVAARLARRAYDDLQDSYSLDDQVAALELSLQAGHADRVEDPSHQTVVSH